METVIPIAVPAPGEEKRCLTTSKPPSGRMITLRFDDIVEKLKQMEEQESGEAWVEDEEEWEKAGKAKSLPAGKHCDTENTTEGKASAQQQEGVEEDEDADEECEPGLTPRPGEGSQIDDPELARAKRRMNVLVEIVETEKDYYRDLEILNNVRPLPQASHQGRSLLGNRD
jgi:hypothetical protein